MTLTAGATNTPVWTDPSCPVARTLDLVGDRWSLLIVRDAMDGATAFTDFQRRTGIARNILTDRLRRLAERGILERRPGESGNRQLYTLTDDGRDLFAVIVTLRQWGEQHAFSANEPRSVLLDRNGAQVSELWPTGPDGSRLASDSTSVQKAG